MTGPLRVLSLFSGVGGFDLGLERAGMTTVAQVEWDAKCQSVLARHWPDVPRWGDVSDVRGADLPDCDLVAFGSPCQDLSVAGRRAGMVAGETRSGLFYEAIRIIKELQEDGRPPAWVVWENVVGALSSNRGHDFAAVLDSLGELGAVDIQWRVLDAQHFGVPQRRRRVFVVARLDPRAVGGSQVLPLGEGVRGNPAARDEAGAVVAALTANGAGTCGADDNQGQAGHLIAARESGQGYWMEDDLAGPLRALQGGVPSQIVADTDATEREMTLDLPQTVGTLSPGAHPDGLNGQDAYTGQIIPFVKSKRAQNVDDDETWKDGEVAPTLNAFDNGGDSRATVVAVEEQSTVWSFDSTWSGAFGVCANQTPPMKCGNGTVPAVAGDTEGGQLAVRRLTPRECERLMGWPDDWTRWTADGKEVADSNRYRMCGNGVASPVAEWIGQCIIAAHGEVEQ